MGNILNFKMAVDKKIKNSKTMKFLKLQVQPNVGFLITNPTCS